MISRPVPDVGVDRRHGAGRSRSSRRSASPRKMVHAAHATRDEAESIKPGISFGREPCRRPASRCPSIDSLLHELLAARADRRLGRLVPTSAAAPTTCPGGPVLQGLMVGIEHTGPAVGAVAGLGVVERRRDLPSGTGQPGVPRRGPAAPGSPQSPRWKRQLGAWPRSADGIRSSARCSRPGPATATRSRDAGTLIATLIIYTTLMGLAHLRAAGVTMMQHWQAGPGQFGGAGPRRPPTPEAASQPGEAP